MSKRSFVVTAMLLTGFLSAAAQLPSVHWKASSTTAVQATGDIESAPYQLTANGKVFSLSPLRVLEPVGLQNAAKLFSAPLTPRSFGQVFSLNMPASTTIKGGNTLCGNRRVRFAVVLVTGEGSHSQNLYLALFTGSQSPVLLPRVVNNSTNLCGTFSYSADDAH